MSDWADANPKSFTQAPMSAASSHGCRTGQLRFNYRVRRPWAKRGPLRRTIRASSSLRCEAQALSVSTHHIGQGQIERVRQGRRNHASAAKTQVFPTEAVLSKVSSPNWPPMMCAVWRRSATPSRVAKPWCRCALPSRGPPKTGCILFLARRTVHIHMKGWRVQRLGATPRNATPEWRMPRNPRSCAFPSADCQRGPRWVNCLWPTSRRTCAKVASIAMVPRAPLTTKVIQTLKVSTPKARVSCDPGQNAPTLLRCRGAGVGLHLLGSWRASTCGRVPEDRRGEKPVVF